MAPYRPTFPFARRCASCTFHARARTRTHFIVRMNRPRPSSSSIYPIQSTLDFPSLHGIGSDFDEERRGERDQRGETRGGQVTTDDSLWVLPEVGARASKEGKNSCYNFFCPRPFACVIVVVAVALPRFLFMSKRLLSLEMPKALLLSLSLSLSRAPSSFSLNRRAIRPSCSIY